MFKKIHNDQSGIVLLVVLAISMVMIVTSLSILNSNLNLTLSGQRQVDRIKADQIAKGQFWRNHASLVTTGNPAGPWNVPLIETHRDYNGVVKTSTKNFCASTTDQGIAVPPGLNGTRRYDISVTDVTWVIVSKEHVGFKLPASIKVEFVEGNRRLEDLLVEGKIDAEVEPDLPQAWIRGAGTVERLFADFAKAEREYYARTKIFPIMHPVVIKKEILDRDPWVATSLFEAFMAARRVYNDFMEQPHRLSFAWARSYLEEERKFFGKDPFYQGFRENYHDVQTLITFADQQGMLGRKLTVEELFTENTRGT